MEWPFDQPKNCATVTVKQIMEGENFILVVYHNEDDHGWQFMTGEGFEMEDAMLVSLEEVVNVDPTVVEISNMEPGYHAWRRHIGDQWVIAKTPEEEDDE